MTQVTVTPGRPAGDLPPATTTRFSTARVPRADRLPLWEDYNSRSLLQISCNTLASGSLLAAQQNLHLPRLNLTEIRANDHVVERSARDIRTAPTDTVLLCLLLEGRAFHHAPEQTLALEAGDVLLYASDQPFLYGFGTNMRQVIAEVPRTLFADLMDNARPGGGPDPLATELRRGRPPQARVLRAGAASGGARSRKAQPTGNAIAHTLVRTIQDALSAPPHDVRRLEDTTLDLFALLAGAQPASTAGHMLAAREHVRTHLADPELGPGSIARAVGLSERHLSRLFAADGTTVAEYMLSARLAHARARLKDPAEAATPIGDIARTTGFASAAHFSRTFKAAFGMSPRDVRAAGAG
ncbi:helix-turn-helix domain-containing protein [Arthrobacter ginkgonis]|uniref:Helix-turn-helix domain-containing protein n=1 Tax=Arthrobacter ginkgonis TaxID=1630594 RepID=A0ABP7CFA2_9MICC